MNQPQLAVLAVDDEPPALDELGFLLRKCPLVSRVTEAATAADALRALQQDRFDAVLLDIRMPELDGLEMARILSQFTAPPRVVFVTAHEQYALEAFDVEAAGYLLKPVDRERLLAVLQRVAARRQARGGNEEDTLDTVAVELAGRTRMVQRDEVCWVEAAGDYVRLHTASIGSPLVRIPLAMLEEQWTPRGFVRIHRSYLVALRSVRELRSDGPQTVVAVDGAELPVSRRHLPELRERLLRGTRPWR
ncbi:MAG: response regulator transcription factor [Acidimicrobiaceae bacterium]|nr:response regulator transcription factor [Acidimicrobiaceae bacterium]